MWISAKFHLQVIRAYDQLVTAPAVQAIPNFGNPAEAARAWAFQYEMAEASKAQGVLIEAAKAQARYSVQQPKTGP